MQQYYKRKYDEELVEAWVNCDRCQSSFHQICALYSPRSQSKACGYRCPFCILETAGAAANQNAETSKAPSTAPSVRLSPAAFAEESWRSEQQWSANALPRSIASDYLEISLQRFLESKGYADVSHSICVRMVSNYDRLYNVPAAIRENLPTRDGHRPPSKLIYRQKCLALFQSIDGIDVMLFCIYIHEYCRNRDSPTKQVDQGHVFVGNDPPNDGVVYISYLDSVEYFQPMHLRSQVYQELVASYLQYAALRGFEKCFLWSCPPQRGDNFIFWCHPLHQTPLKRDRLNGWYAKICSRLIKEKKCASKVEKLWSSYFHQYQNRSCIGNNAAQHWTVGSSVGGGREAAKKSFVGSGRAAAIHKRAKTPKISNAAQHASSLSSSAQIDSVAAETCPFSCPPIFEEDYWVREYLRLYSLHEQKRQQAANNSFAVNASWCRDLIKSMIRRPQAEAFRKPVDPVQLKIPTYFEVIKQPMDLGTVLERCKKLQYRTVLEFARVSASITSLSRHCVVR